MLGSRLLWTLFVVLSAGAAIFTLRNFSTAFPLVSIELKVDRADALRSARTIAQRNAWPPEGFDQAAEFGGSQEVQNFVELEGGGKQELGRILKEKIFALYTWRVRHFKQGDAHETLIRFTPDGTPYGFSVKLPEEERRHQAGRRGAADRRNGGTARLGHRFRPISSGRIFQRSEARRTHGSYFCVRTPGRKPARRPLP